MHKFMITLIAFGFLIYHPLSHASKANHYQAAKKALVSNNFKQYQFHVKAMGDYILKPVIESQYLLTRFNQVDGNTIESFLNKNSDIYLNNSLRTKYLNQLVKQKIIGKFQQLYRGDVNETNLECYYLNHKIKSNEIDTQTDMQIEQIWLSSDSLPDSCNPLFRKWSEAGKLSNDRIWMRIEMAIKDSQYTLASYLAENYLPARQQSIAQLWIAVLKNPSRELKSSRFKDSIFAGKIISDGLEQIAKNDPEQAARNWNQLKKAQPFLIKFDPQVYAKIGLRAAVDHIPHASDYLLKASFDDEQVRHWAIRSALRDQQWNYVLEFFSRLTDEEKTLPDWRYWQARGLQETGENPRAQMIFKEISNQRDYYSFLAADKAGLDYQMNNRPIVIPTTQPEDSRALKIAKELYVVEGVSQMRRQWQWAIRNLSPTQLKIAAKIASKWGFHDRAIITAAKAKYFDDVNLRFPLVHKNYVINNSKINKLPNAYVYAIMRQESAFMEKIKSPAGALGLMQIMPATGKSIWEKQNKSNYHLSKLLDPSTNINMGSFYLREMLNRFDNNYAMATAAYNAGPSRAKKWRASHTLEADIWIESIPFKETRRYVKNVLTYKTIYDSLLGNNNRLSSLLSSIKAG